MDDTCGIVLTGAATTLSLPLLAAQWLCRLYRLCETRKVQEQEDLAAMVQGIKQGFRGLSQQQGVKEGGLDATTSTGAAAADRGRARFSLCKTVTSTLATSPAQTLHGPRPPQGGDE